MTEAQLEELIRNLRACEREADSIDPGCRFAVMLGQAHRAISELASRAPGPATAAIVEEAGAELARMVRGEGRQLVLLSGTWSRVGLLRAFIAEHQPEKPPARPDHCPWKRSDTTPCVRTDGPLAYADDHRCIGCGRRPIATGVLFDDPRAEKPGHNE